MRLVSVDALSRYPSHSFTIKRRISRATSSSENLIIARL
jgi:hypothetical protein